MCNGNKCECVKCTCDETVKTKVHKIEILVVDHNDVGIEEIKLIVEGIHYPNRCIWPTVLDVKTEEVDWNDNHPLNVLSTTKQAANKLFNMDKDSIYAPFPKKGGDL